MSCSQPYSSLKTIPPCTGPKFDGSDELLITSVTGDRFAIYSMHS